MRIVISMWDSLESEGAEMYLNNSGRGYEVIRTPVPRDLADWCAHTKEPYDVLIVDVVPNSWANFQARMELLRSLREAQVKAKFIVAIDVNSFPAEALRLCVERDSGTVDALFSDSEEGELLRVLDSLFPNAAP